MKNRQDRAASLPSDLMRHLSQAKEQFAEATTDSQKAEIQADWEKMRKDAVWNAFMGSCLTGCFRWCALPKRLA